MLRHAAVPGGRSTKHINQASGVAAIKVAVADLATSTARYSALLGKSQTPIQVPSSHHRMNW
jgi:hypothetical protein